MSYLTWTADTPSVPGWYWCGPVSSPVMSIIEVRRFDGSLYAVAGNWKGLISEFDALWAGPIPQPEYEP